MEETKYGYRKVVEIPYEEAVAKARAELQKEGFGVLTEIDVKETIKKKLGQDFRKYIILGACNPPLAHKALTTELEIGLLLPCNVIIYEEEGRSVVAAINPMEALRIVGKPELEELARQVSEKLKRVIDNV